MNPPTAAELAAVELEKEGMVRETSNRKRTSSSNSRKGKGKRRLLHSQTEGPPVHHGALRAGTHNQDIMFNAGNAVVSGEQRDLLASNIEYMRHTAKNLVEIIPEMETEGLSGPQTRTFDQRPQLLLATGVHQMQLNCSERSSARSGRSPEIA